MNKNKFESKIKVCVTITNGGSDYYVNVANNDDAKHYVCIRNQYKVQILKEEVILFAVADFICYNATTFLEYLRKRKFLEYLRKEINNNRDSFLLEVDTIEKTIDGDRYLVVEVTKTMMDMNTDTKSYYYPKPLSMPIEAMVLFTLTKWLGCYPELFLKCFFVTEKNK